MERKQNVTEIKKLLLARKEGEGQSYLTLYRFLLSKGIAGTLAEEIAISAAKNPNTIEGLKETLAAKVRTGEEITFQTGAPTFLALVGPTGVGKSTTLIKIADFYLQKGKKVGILNLDIEKRGQIEKYSPMQEVPIVYTEKDLNLFIEKDLILIDTPGCNYYQPNRVDAIGERLALIETFLSEIKSPSSLEIHLTLSAAIKDVDIFGAIHQFSSLNLTGLIFTKLDETLATGVLINTSVKTHYPIRYIAYGYPLPGKVQVANPYEITHKILVDLNQDEFQNLRQLSVNSE